MVARALRHFVVCGKGMTCTLRQYCGFMVTQALSNFKTSIILLYMVKDHLTGCGLNVYSLVSSYLAGLANMVACF